MNTTKLAEVLRAHGEQLGDKADRDTTELILVLARILEGKTVYRAFGAPGDWGYSNPIGAALAVAYKSPSDLTDERFNGLLNGALSGPMPMMTLNRLAIALRVVVKDTGKVGEESLLEHCRSRAAKDAIGEQAE